MSLQSANWVILAAPGCIQNRTKQNSLAVCYQYRTPHDVDEKDRERDLENRWMIELTAIGMAHYSLPPPTNKSVSEAAPVCCSGRFYP